MKFQLKSKHLRDVSCIHHCRKTCGLSQTAKHGIMFATLVLFLATPLSIAETIGGRHGIVKISSLGWEQKINFTEPRSKPVKLLRKAALTGGGGFSSGTASAVGGVLFMEKANPDFIQPVKTFSAFYDSAESDGRRMKLIVDADTLYIPVYDWILIPAIKYVDDGNHSCFTLFGHLSDTAEETRTLKSNRKIMNYHPAFENTLAGLRLMQMDILIIAPPITGALPCDEKGNTILGAGEYEPVKEDAYNAAAQFQHRVNINGAFRSYLVTDRGRNITFKKDGDHVVFTGNLKYWFWDYKWQPINSSDTGKINFEIIQNNANTNISNRLNTFFTDSLRIAWLGDTLRQMSEYHKTMMPFGRLSSPLLKRFESMSMEFHGRFLDTLSLQNRYNLAVAFATAADFFEITELKDISNVIDENISYVRAINPQIWDAAEVTMRVSALLRYIKVANPGSWQKLVEVSALIHTEPMVATPHVLDQSMLEIKRTR